MSDEHNENRKGPVNSVRRRRRRPGKKKISVRQWVIIAVLSLFTIAIAMQVHQYIQLIQMQNQLQNEIDVLREKNAALEEEKKKLETHTEIEKVAREQLGMVKPGEVPYVK